MGATATRRNGSDMGGAFIGALLISLAAGGAWYLYKNQETETGGTGTGSSSEDSGTSIFDTLTLPGTADTIVFPSSTGYDYGSSDSGILGTLAALIAPVEASDDPVLAKKDYSSLLDDSDENIFSKPEEAALPGLNLETSEAVGAAAVNAALPMLLLGPTLGTLVSNGLLIGGLLSQSQSGGAMEGTTNTEGQNTLTKKSETAADPASSYTLGSFTTSWYQNIAETNPSVMAGGSDTAAYGSFMGYGLSTGATPSTFVLGKKYDEGSGKLTDVEIVSYDGGGWEARDINNGQIVASGSPGAPTPSSTQEVGAAATTLTKKSSSGGSSASSALKAALSSKSSGYATSSRTVGTTSSGVTVAGH